MPQELGRRDRRSSANKFKLRHYRLAARPKKSILPAGRMTDDG